MVNPILGVLNQSRIAPIKNMFNMIRSAKNPQAALNQMIQNNPQISRILQQNGGDPQRAFYSVASQLGVDGDEIINMLK